jgi:hypothetical protein
MQVHVVMGNDFPDRVYTDEAMAEKFCNEQMALQRRGLKSYERPRIYWRVYSFELIEAVTLEGKR